ncbi:MAG: hypothetical protein LBU09_01350 [Endomicrobium sp.]|jgi:hypothetical protein|nr:hypothetical protein [Endomicrobium sp.]
MDNKKKFEEFFNRVAQVKNNEFRARHKKNATDDKSLKISQKPVISGQAEFEFVSNINITTNNGIELGVLEGGIPYLSQRGLVAMSGIARTTFQTLSDNWEKAKNTGTAAEINKILEKKGYKEKFLYIKVKTKNSGTIHAYTETVCMAVLEYCAFDKKIDKAIRSLRTFLDLGFRSFIYQAAGYQLSKKILDKWAHFHDRISLNSYSVPKGYFSVFKEVSGIIYDMLVSGFPLNDETVPDGSVGIHWGKYWKDNNLSEEFGDRIPYEHNYPEYFRQAASNPQPAKAYPLKALGKFREWLENEYLIKKFPPYMLKKIAQLGIGSAESEKLLSLYNPQQLENNI